MTHQHGYPRSQEPKRWADLDVESDEELNSTDSPCYFGNSSGSLGSRDNSQFDSDDSASRSGSATPVRHTKGTRVRNRALSKQELAGMPALNLAQHTGDDAMSSMSGSGSLGSTRSTGSNTEEDSADASGSNHIGTYSVGGDLHDAGQCKPCLFVHTQVGCQNGATCEFCHWVHKRKSRPRPCKGKRDRYRKLLNRMQENLPRDDTSDAGDTGDTESSHASLAHSSSNPSLDPSSTVASI